MTESRNKRIAVRGALVLAGLLAIAAGFAIWEFVLRRPALADLVAQNDLRSVSDHLANGGNVNLPLQRDSKMIHFVRSREMIELLMKAGADANSRTADGVTPLHIAAHLRSPQLIESLLHHGADPNSLDDFSRTPLHWLAESVLPSDARYLFPRSAVHPSDSAASPVMLLVNAGAQSRTHDRSGESPADVAARWNDPNLAAELDRAPTQSH